MAPSGALATPERFVTFEPSAWHNFFVKYNPAEPLRISEEYMRVKAGKLKEEILMLLKTFCGTVVEKLALLDTLQHLGIDHLFQQQINMMINEIHENEFYSCSLYEVSLHFRLLREHGCWVTPDVFNKFKAKDGSFMKDITNEPRELLGLYNAAHLSIRGESELDEAIIFARHHLESMKGSLKYPLSEQVKRNLEIPYPRALKRINAPHYITEYEQDKTCIPSLLELAKLDFNLLQRLHQRELKDFCRWGNDLYEEVQLSYSRDRIVECYFWSNIMQYEEQYGHARIILAKVFVLLTLLDDTFDMHATLEEGRKLNEAIQRWEESDVLLVPEYLKKYYVRLMNTFIEIETELKPDHKYRVAYSRKALQTLRRHYQQESEWFHSSYIPSFDDHLKCSLISSGIPMLIISSIVGMGDEASKEVFEWASGCTDAVHACTVVGRLMNDMTSFKRGKNKLDVASSVDSYINQYHVRSEVALATLDNIVQDAWKTSNQARFDHHALLPLLQRIMRLTRSMTLMYHDNVDRYTSSRGNKDKIEQQFVEAIPL